MTDREAKARQIADLDTAVRQRIKSVRSQQGLTQSAVAQELGIVPQQYHKYESGVLRLSGGMIARIAAVLDCSVLDLVPEEIRGERTLDASKRIDILKQELTMLVLDQESEEVLVALKVLLRQHFAAERPVEKLRA